MRQDDKTREGSEEVHCVAIYIHFTNQFGRVLNNKWLIKVHSNNSIQPGHTDNNLLFLGGVQSVLDKVVDIKFELLLQDLDTLIVSEPDVFEVVVGLLDKFAVVVFYSIELMLLFLFKRIDDVFNRIHVLIFICITNSVPELARNSISLIWVL